MYDYFNEKQKTILENFEKLILEKKKQKTVLKSL